MATGWFLRLQMNFPHVPWGLNPPKKFKGGSGGVYKGGKFWTFLDQIEGVLKLPQVSPVMFLRCSKGPIGQYLNQLNCQNYWTLHWTTRSLVFLTSNWGLSQPRGVFDLAKKSQNDLFSGLQWHSQLVWCRNWCLKALGCLGNQWGQFWRNFKIGLFSVVWADTKNIIAQRWTEINLIPRT